MFWHFKIKLSYSFKSIQWNLNNYFDSHNIYFLKMNRKNSHMVSFYSLNLGIKSTHLTEFYSNVTCFHALRDTHHLLSNILL